MPGCPTWRIGNQHCAIGTQFLLDHLEWFGRLLKLGANYSRRDVTRSDPPFSGRGRSWITGLAGISGLGPNTEPRGNNRSFPETRKRTCVPANKIGSRDSIFGLVNSTYFFKITNHNQHASNIKYLANSIKKYWTCFHCQKLSDLLVCFPPSVRVQVRWPPSWKICLRIQLSFGFWGRAVKACDNFSRKLAWLLKTIF